MRAGSAVVTPSQPGELAGYIARNGALSTGTHDELEAALIVLDDGSQRVAWLTLDAIAVTAALDVPLRAAIVEALGDTAVVIAASHSHSAPLGWTGSIHPGNPGRRSDAAAQELVERVGALARSLAPAVSVRAEWSSAPVAGVGTNRLSPDGPHDSTVGVLALRDADDEVRAVLFDFATHPTVLGPANLRWSADWPGAARAVIRDSLGGAVVGFLQGAAGDVSSRFTRRSDGFGEVSRLGALVGEGALGALRRGRPLDGPLRVASGDVTLRRRALPSKEDAEAAVVDAATAIPDGSPLDPAVRLAQTRHDGARVQRDLAAADLPDALTLPLAVVSLGELAWAYVPVELFASLGASIAAASPFPITRVIGYSNGYTGYLADAAAHASGSYEALSSFFPPEESARLVDAMTDLLTLTIPEPA